MSKRERPTSADTKPMVVQLQAGKSYYWCACGKSAQQPFCDGSHSGSLFAPKNFRCDEDGTAYLCMCKLTRNPPYCDGSHKSLI
jgi:CDGSH-type Zn-finger protein